MADSKTIINRRHTKWCINSKSLWKVSLIRDKRTYKRKLYFGIAHLLNNICHMIFTFYKLAVVQNNDKWIHQISKLSVYFFLNFVKLIQKLTKGKYHSTQRFLSRLFLRFWNQGKHWKNSFIQKDRKIIFFFLSLPNSNLENFSTSSARYNNKMQNKIW